MKQLIITLFIMSQISFAQASSSVSADSIKQAKAAAGALLSIAFGSKGSNKLKVVSTKVVTSDDIELVEEVEVSGSKLNSKGETISTELIYKVEVLNGLIWSIQTTCRACG